MRLLAGRIKKIKQGLLLVVAALQACSRPAPDAAAVAADTQFTALPSAVTGIDFVNTIRYTEDYNPYTFRNFFNGGGVGLGDFNNDGRLDLFFCANMAGNRLYLNEGNWRFRDITSSAGLRSPEVWSSGVAVVDINADGWLDLYVCKSGKPQGKRRKNELFINNGNLTFTEKAAEYGLDDLGLSTHAAFFDYDRDGDLDCYLLNNSVRSVGGYDLVKDQRNQRNPEGGNKLLRNDGGRFTDVSAAAGIYGSSIGFGLGVTVGDVNRDGWPDLYVSNDFFERDYLYLNQQNGTFAEVLESQLPEISLSSMGADMADLNNDGFPEIFVTDMLPREERRVKTKTTFEDWNKFQRAQRNGYHRQFTRNVLQRNNGDGTFSEIGRLAGVEATDWSWGALIVDLDNDRRKDIFVANGLLRDLTDQDYINFYSDPTVVRDLISKQRGKAVITQMVDAMPSEPIPNFAFQNQGDFQFVDRAKAWGLGAPSFSNGSAYGDLDNDGDLDLVVNNINQAAGIFRNNTRQRNPENGNYLRLELRGDAANPFAIGAQVTLKHQGGSLFQELFPMRGFESSVDYRLLFGLGNWNTVDTLLVQWPDGRTTLRTQVKANQTLQLAQNEGLEAPRPNGQPTPTWFKEVTSSTGLGAFPHQENDFSDFDRERLLYHMYSAEGPKLALGDVNGDGREDLYRGGAKDQPGVLLLQTAAGRFQPSPQPAFLADQICEDTDATFFDADNDGDLDLYVCSGGNEFPTSSSALADRLYLNDGSGHFTKSNQILPTFQFESSSCVAPGDYDGDGDQDLFVGIRLQPFLYGVPVNGYILQNNGQGFFTDVTRTVAPALVRAGLITAARWADLDGDRDLDLVVAGEWMPIKIWRNTGGRFEEVTTQVGMEKSQGFWNTFEVADLDGDGDLDLIGGNLGRNTRYRASPAKPMTMYVNDFDGNGSADPFICQYNGDQSYPLALLHDVVKQLPGLRKKYLKYTNYQGQTIADIFTPDLLQRAIKWEVYTTETAIALNDGRGRFRWQPLPLEAQLSPVYAILVHDFNRDGHPDLLLGGNCSRVKPEIGGYYASYGVFLKGTGGGNFQAIPPQTTGWRITGEVRDLVLLGRGRSPLVLVARNNDTLLASQWNF